jgi:hypothetical protein
MRGDWRGPRRGIPRICWLDSGAVKSASESILPHCVEGMHSLALRAQYATSPPSFEGLVQWYVLRHPAFEFAGFGVDFDFVADFDECRNLHLVLGVLQDRRLGDLA